MKTKKFILSFLIVFCALCIFFSGCAQSCAAGCGGNDGGIAGEEPDDTADDTPNGGENDSGNGGDTDGNFPDEMPEAPESPVGPERPDDGGQIPSRPFESGIYNLSKVGYCAQYLGSFPRTLPQVSDGGLGRYPRYGVTLENSSVEEREAIIAENNLLVAGADTYDSMDMYGNLFLNGSPTGRKLCKHTAAYGMYEGNLADDEQAIIKRITYIPRGTYGNLLTGLYAPAGEVVRIEMSAEDLKSTGGLTVYIGQFLSNGGQNSIGAAREFNRMPVIGNKMTASEQTSYVGSFLGGPIYIAPKNDCGQFTVTISGGVSYPHYIHGYTSPEEFESCKNSTAPYFDLEVWDDSVRHSGPAARAATFSYGQLRDAATLWDKIACVSNMVPAGSGGSEGINFLYDPFVAAGSMVAFVGRHTVNCPPQCLTAALDARSAVENAVENFWGCIHEFNHHYQKFGFVPGDEVTNNAVSLVEYSLFTRISSNRALGNSSQGSYACGWNRYTNPAWALARTLENDGVNSDLDGYANLLHSFGQEKFIEATRLGEGRGGADVWFKAVSDATGYDMAYYFTEVLHQPVSADVLAEYAAKNAPVYVPVATIFQTARGHICGDELVFCPTAHPYVVRAGQDFELNLKDNIILPAGLSFQIKSVCSPQNGTLVQKEYGIYTYSPDAYNNPSGKIYVTLGITKDDGAFAVDDVVLAIELAPGYSNAPVTRTTYLYGGDKMYKSAVDAYESGYAGYISVTAADNVNRVQNGNCEIWEPGYSDNAVMELSGKVYIPSDGKYRFALRGRYYAALYISTDGVEYHLAGRLDEVPRTSEYFLDDPSTFEDCDLKAGQYVWFKEVLLVNSADAYIGLGMGKFVGDDVSVAHVTDGLNVNHVVVPFESQYVFAREYAYNGAETPSSQSLISSKYSPWSEDYAIDNLFDGNYSNFIHSDRVPIDGDNPFEITVDLGEVMRANTFTIYGEPTRRYQPKNFVLYGGTSPDDMHVIASVQNAVLVGDDVVITFDEEEFRYYKLVVTDTYSDYGYIAFRRVQPSYVSAVLEGAVQLSPDELSYTGNWQVCPGASFGHSYVCSGGAARLNFTGTRFGVLSCNGENFVSFDVYIDGEYADTVIYGGSKEKQLLYVSGELNCGEHEVELRSLNPFNIDSVIIK